MEEMSNEQMLSELISNQKKLVRQARLTSIVNILIGLVLIAVIAMFIPQLRHVEASLTDIDLLVADAGELVSNTNSMVTENTDAVTETVQKLNDVDFEGLNTAIENLNTAIEPLTALAGLFH